MADAQIQTNLIYGTKKMPFRSRIDYLEIDMDFYQVFKDIAEKTGGTVDASSEPVQSLMKITGLLLPNEPEKKP